MSEEVKENEEQKPGAPVTPVETDPTDKPEQPQDTAGGTPAIPERPTDTTDKPKSVEPREIVTHQCGAGMDEAIKILVLDEPGPGNACHEYAIGLEDSDVKETIIRFQKGAVAETGPNGISIESILAVAIHRLEGFQSGPYPCAENAAALDHLQRALRNLQKRTIERATRNAEEHSTK
jgi:hypothetical protein